MSAVVTVVFTARSTVFGVAMSGIAVGFFFGVAFRFGQQRFVAQLEFVVFLIDSDYFDFESIADIEYTFEGFGSLPLVLADMHEAFFAWEEFHEGTKLYDTCDCGCVNLPHFGNGADIFDPFDGGVDGVFVDGGDIDDTDFAFFFDIDDGVGLFLNFLDDFATLTDYGTNEVLRNLYLDDARYEWFVIFARFGNSRLDVVEDVETTLASLLKSFGEDVVGEAVDLDIHLAGGYTVASATNLEVHIAEVIFVAEDVGEDCPFVAFRDESHGDACNRFADFDTCVHKSQTSSTYGSHRGGAVGFEDVGNDADGVGAFGFGRKDLLESAPSEVSVTDFTAREAAVAFDFTGSETWEVVVEEEAACAFNDGAVDDLLIELGAEGDSRERLCFTTSEYGGAVSRREVAYFAPERANFVELTTVEASAFVEDHVAHGFALGVVVVAVDHEFDVVGEGFFGIVGFDELLLDGFEALFALVFIGDALFGKVVAFLVDGIAEVLAEFFVVDFVAVFAFGSFASFDGELGNGAALNFDGFMSGFECIEHYLFADFLHFAFDHHDVFFGCSDDEVEVSTFDVGHRGVDDVMSVEIGDADLGDGAVEGDVGDG